MYAYIKGILIESSPRHVILETNGIGFFLLIPVSLFSELPPLGSPLLLHTSFIVREEAQTLYGFISQRDKQLFENLITISGIGPKTALSLVGHMSIDDLQTAIQHNQIQTICKIPGIGKKTAERLIVELRDKLTSKSLKSSLPKHTTAPSIFDDAASALANLGYSASVIEKTLNKILSQKEKPQELASLITLALRSI